MTELKICGYGAVFNYRDHHFDVISTNSNIMFRKYDHKLIKTEKSKFLLPMKYNHDEVIGFWKYCCTTNYGIFLIGEIHKKYVDIYNMVLKSEMFLSIAGYVKRSRQNRLKYNTVERYLEAIEIVEVSLTKYPANRLCGCIQYVNKNYK